MAHELTHMDKEKRCKIVLQAILQRFFGGKRWIRTFGIYEIILI
jgi:hypothetical protein